MKETRGERRQYLYPPTVALPEVGGNRPQSMEIMVVLPAPFEPSTPRH